MAKEKTRFLWIGMLVASFSVAHPQSPQQIIQQVVDSEHAADEDYHSQWIYLEEIRKPKERVLQLVATTQQGDVQRVLERDEQRLSASEQRDLIQNFLHDTRAQKKQASEIDHDNKQIDDLLQLLPIAFLWTQTGATATTTVLHFEPAPHFHPPTREARVFCSMAGDLIVDNRQHRVRGISGHLMREVRFGGGILGKLKEGGSFSLEQEEVRPSLWQLTAFHVRLEGSALFLKTVSLQQDDKRSDFESEPSTITLNQAATEVMSQPEVVRGPATPTAAQ